MSTPNATPVTSDKALFTFYDIESLNNAFTLCTYSPRENIVHAFYLIDEDGSAASAINKADPPAHSVQPTVASRTIMEHNQAFDGDIVFHNLRNWEANIELAKIVGLSDADYVNNPYSESTFGADLRPVCDTDHDYDPINKHPYLAGYNSTNYDTVILALYLAEAFRDYTLGEDTGLGSARYRPTEASLIRSYNDRMFSEDFKKQMPRYLVDEHGGWNGTANKIRRSMLNSGRHIDIARLNEVQQMVGLKRLLGGLGRQIMESDKLGSHNARLETVEEFCELLAYNVSDVVGLAKLFEHPTYSSGFDLKKGLLDEYPETIYNAKPGTSEPDINPRSVRRNRLGPDSTSARFAATILAPYKPLTDWETVSFVYPEKSVAEARGVEQVNVLDESKRFFDENVHDEEARWQFQQVYMYYKSIEGKNFNESGSMDNYSYNKEGTYRAHYTKVHGGQFPPTLEPLTLKNIPKRPNNIPYFYEDGRPSRAFATFSTGGIHGAEADWEAWQADAAQAQAYNAMLQEVMEKYPDPLDVRQEKVVTLDDGTEIPYKDVLTSSKSTIKALKARSEFIEEVLGGDPKNPTQSQIEKAEEEFPGVGFKKPKALPELFEAKTDGSTKLKTKYAYTSAEPAIHEDFTSYYPNLLRGMNAFYNPDLGEDRYAKIFFDKERYGQQRKDPSLSEEERSRINVLREGTKLILNAASGAGDATHDNNIRMNNVIISMRILGQLFSWRIGQAQTLAGAKIISTNTDGLYSAGLDRETNDRILEEQAAATGVEIEPEPMIVISKDANNRLELDVPEGDTPVWEAPIIGASGGSLACHQEPQPTKSLAHPAVLDWALARYLRYIVGGYQPEWRDTPLTLDEPLDERMGKQLMKQAVQQNDPTHAARLFQHIVSASVGSITFPFASDPVDPEGDLDQISNPRPLQHYSRCFIVHANKPGAVSLRAAGAWKVNPASQLKRERAGESAIQDDDVAIEILRANGFTRKHSEAKRGLELLPTNEDTAVRKISSIEPYWNILIDNTDLVEKSDEQLAELLGCLDLDVYVEMLASTFNANWKRTQK